MEYKKLHLVIIITAIMLLGMFVIWIQETYAYTDEFSEKYPYVWVPNIDGTYRKVDIYFVDGITGINRDTGVPTACKLATGCHYVSEIRDYIELNKKWYDKGHGWRSGIGGSVWEHEVYHAWGITHAEMEYWFNPYIEIHPLLLADPPKWPNKVIPGTYSGITKPNYNFNNLPD